MSKRMANILDLQVPPPPTIQEFVSCLEKWVADREQGPPADPVHGTLFHPKGPQRPRGTESSERAGVRYALQFAKMCTNISASDPLRVYPSLDAWLVGWGGWVVDPSHLFQTEEERDVCKVQRQAVANADFPYTTMSVMTFRTYVNAVARVYNGGAQNGMVPSSKKQFPLFNAFIEPCFVRSKAVKAINSAQRPEVEVLSVEELKKVMQSSASETSPLILQRRNALPFAFATGIRAEMLRRLVVQSFKEGEKTDDGRRTMTMVLGTMKNLPATMTSVDAALFKQVLVQGDDPDLCPIAALDRQMELLGKCNAKPEENFLFRAASLHAKTVLPKPAGRDIFFSIAGWVSSILGRTLTFKDVGRRAAMTRAANSGVSLQDVAKYFGVHRNTVAVYHKMGNSVPVQIAKILVGHPDATPDLRIKDEPTAKETKATNKRCDLLL